MLEFETYVRNYRKEVLVRIDHPGQLFVDKLVIVEIDTCEASVYKRAMVISAKFDSGVCRVSNYIQLFESSKMVIVKTTILRSRFS